MKIAVRYLSRGGNTRMVAEAIAREAGVKAEPLTVPLNETVDILFLGSGVYALYKFGFVDRKVKDFLEALKPDDVKSIAAFSTGATISGTGKITDMVKAKGIGVCKHELPLKMGAKSGGVTLSEKQLSLIADFVRQAIQ